MCLKYMNTFTKASRHTLKLRKQMSKSNHITNRHFKILPLTNIWEYQNRFREKPQDVHTTITLNHSKGSKQKAEECRDDIKVLWCYFITILKHTLQTITFDQKHSLGVDFIKHFREKPQEVRTIEPASCVPMYQTQQARPKNVQNYCVLGCNNLQVVILLCYYFLSPWSHSHLYHLL